MRTLISVQSYSSMMAAERLDLLILGATGFTGIHCIPYVYKLTKEKGRNLTWGVSGRSEEKLKEALSKTGGKIGLELSEIPIVLCDIKNEDSLLKMAQKTKIVINCCGPYVFLGEPVVKACIAAGSHYVDVSGEPEFIETVQLKYHEEAAEKGIYIVSACGLDSMPCDLGSVFVQQKFDGTLNSIVSYLEFWEEGEPTPGPGTNYGTWESIVYGIANSGKLAGIRRKLFPEKLPSFKPELKLRIFPHHPLVVEGWALPFPGSDRSVMERTQRYFYDKEDKRPVQVDTQFVLKSVLRVVGIIMAMSIWFVLAKFKYGRSLLLNYPHIFTGGMFVKDQNPSEEKVEKIIWQITFYGEGWSEKLPNKDEQYTIAPNKNIVAKVKGRNPAYGSTCVCLVGAAIMIASEKDKLPKDGGVYTSGAAFAKTSLVELLNQNGVNFDVISQKNL